MTHAGDTDDGEAAVEEDRQTSTADATPSDTTHPTGQQQAAENRDNEPPG